MPVLHTVLPVLSINAQPESSGEGASHQTRVRSNYKTCDWGLKKGKRARIPHMLCFVFLCSEKKVI